jgi:aspartate kinase
MIVMKFGGTSVKDADAMRRVAGIIAERGSEKPVIVLSALSKITDLLEQALTAAATQNTTEMKSIMDTVRERHITLVAELFGVSSNVYNVLDAINKEFERLNILLSATVTLRAETENLYHAVVSAGENLSTRIMTALLNQQGIATDFIDATSIMFTKRSRGKIRPDAEKIKNACIRQIVPVVEDRKVVVTQGFVAVAEDGSPATLGRNGSDYSASLIGAALGVDEIQIWTDTDGILTADPSIIPEALPLETMTFDEASELAYFGAKVLHPASIQPALEAGIPVRVCNSHRPESNGTTILRERTEKESLPVKSIAYKEGITLVTIQSSEMLLSPEIIGDFFKHLTDHGKKVYAVSKSANKLSLTIENRDELNHLLADLNHGGTVDIKQNKAIVTVVGEGVQEDPRLTGQIMELLTGAGIRLELISQFAGQISFMFIIDESDIERTVRLLHDRYIATG